MSAQSYTFQPVISVAAIKEITNFVPPNVELWDLCTEYAVFKLNFRYHFYSLLHSLFEQDKDFGVENEITPLCQQDKDC